MKFTNMGGEPRACRGVWRCCQPLAVAKVSPEEAAKLGIEGTELTPMGAIRAGNADGSIPAWDGGIKTPPAGYVGRLVYVDPYADDKILFTITAQNYQQYEDKLSPGRSRCSRSTRTRYKLNVYPTRRSASYPQWLYDNSHLERHAHRVVQPAAGRAEPRGALRQARGVPAGVLFPIPKIGGEAMWNHTFYWFGKWFTSVTHYGFNAFPDGTYAEHVKRERWMMPHESGGRRQPKGDDVHA